MKSLVTLVGIVLIIVGIAGFSYKYINYTSNEKVAEVGSVQVTADREKQIFISPTMSGLSLAVGLILVVVGISRRE